VNVKELISVDLKLGIRTWVYPLYLLAAIFVGLILRAFPEAITQAIAPVILFMEPSLLGITFIGAIILFDKKDNVLGALAVTPLDMREYIWGKVIMMTSMSLVVAIIILLIGIGLIEKTLYVLWGVFITSLLYTIMGIGMVAKHKSLDDYFVPLLAIFAISLVPIFGFYGIVENELLDAILHLIPSYESLYLIGAAFMEVKSEKIILSSIYLIVLIPIAYIISKKRFYKYAVEGFK